MKPWFLVFVSVFLGALGQVCMKKGMGYVGSVSLRLPALFASLSRMASSPFVLLGICLYAVSTVFWLSVLSKWELSYAYPMISISYILVLVFSWLFFQEKFGMARVLGVVLICCGVFLVSKS